MMINENYKVESDELNVIVSKKVVSNDREGNEKITWRNIAFCPTIESALKYLAKKEVLGTGLKDLETVNEKIKELYKYIENMDFGKK